MKNALYLASVGLLVLASGCSNSTVAKVETAAVVAQAQVEKATVVACKIDGQLQPVLVPLTAATLTAVNPAAAPAVGGMVALDTTAIHPAIVAACAAVEGVAVAVATVK